MRSLRDTGQKIIATACAQRIMLLEPFLRDEKAQNNREYDKIRFQCRTSSRHRRLCCLKHGLILRRCADQDYHVLPRATQIRQVSDALFQRIQNGLNMQHLPCIPNASILAQLLRKRCRTGRDGGCRGRSMDRPWGRLIPHRT